VVKGRPTPPLPNIITNHKTKTTAYKIFFFGISEHEKFDWLAGCANKLQCWPCLPFYNKHEVRDKQGFSDLNHMSFAQQKHPKSQTSALLSIVKSIWKLERLICSSTLNPETTSPGIMNKWSTEPYYVGFIDAVCSVANQEFPFQGKWWVAKIFKQRKFHGISQCVEKKVMAHFLKMMWIQLLLFNFKHKFVVYLMKFGILKFK
jgi:hypothetical protein